MLQVDVEDRLPNIGEFREVLLQKPAPHAAVTHTQFSLRWLGLGGVLQMTSFSLS